MNILLVKSMLLFLNSLVNMHCVYTMDDKIFRSCLKQINVTINQVGVTAITNVLVITHG